MFIRGESISEFDFEGIKIRDYTVGQDLNASVALITVAAGIGHKRALSALSEKYYFVVEGRISFRIGGEKQDLGAGDFCFVPKSTEFSYECLDQKAKMIVVHAPAYDSSAEVFIGDK